MSTAVATDDRPRWARVAHAGCLAELLLGAGVSASNCRAEDAPVWEYWFPALCMVALIGMWRRVAWGRVLFSVFSVILALSVACFLIPDYDADHYGTVTFKRMSGQMPPLWACWLMVVGAATLVLSPPVMAGWRRRWFRSALW